MKITLFVVVGVLAAWILMQAAQPAKTPRKETPRAGATARHGATPVAGESARAKADRALPAGLEAKIARLRRWIEVGDHDLTRDGAMAILREWAGYDARAALEFVHAAVHFPGRNQAYSIPLAKIAAHAPQEVAVWLAENVPAEGRTDIVRQVVLRLQNEAPLNALILADATELPSDYAYEMVLRQVAKEQPQVAVASLAQRSLMSKKRMVLAVLSGWVQSKPEDALAWYLGGNVEHSDEAACGLAVACLKGGRHSFGEIAQKLNLGREQQDELLVDLASEGEKLDPAALAGASDQTRNRVLRVSALRLEESPDSVLELVKNSVGREQQAGVLFNGWSAWLNSDRQSALEWLNQLPDRVLAGEILQCSQREKLMEDPKGALAAADSIRDEKQRTELVQEAMQRLTWTAPEQAACWLADHPSAPLGPGEIASLTLSYLKQDDAAAMTWLAKLEAGSVKDDALSAAALFWSRSEIDFATASMAAIGDSAKRERCMFAVYSRLSSTDAGKADSWLQTQGLSDEVKRSWKTLIDLDINVRAIE